MQEAKDIFPLSANEVNNQNGTNNNQQSMITKYGMAYWRKKNPDDSSYILNQYQLKPIGLGRIISLRQKLELVIGNINVGTQDDTYQLHPMVKYLLQKQIRFDYLERIKETEYEAFLVRDWQREQNQRQFNSHIKTFIHTKISSIKNQLEKQQYKSNSRFDKFSKYIDIIRTKRKENEQRMNKLIQLKRVNILGCDANTNKQDIGFVSDQLWETIDKIQILSSREQSRQFTYFIKQYDDYFGCSKIDNQGLGLLHNIVIRRPTHQKEAVLHSLQEHIFFKSYSEENHKISSFFIKDLCQQLQKFSYLTSTQQSKQFFYWLHPSNVLFDQFKLKPKLSFEPLICEALGLKKQPTSFENLVSLFPTPQYFDYFQSEIQLSATIDLNLLDDPYYMCSDLYVEEKKYDLKKKQDQRKNKIEQLKEKILVWRFLLISYYLIHGKRFEQNRKIQSVNQTRYHFKEKLTSKRIQIIQDNKKLQEFLGCEKGDNFKQGQYQFDFDGLIDYLNIPQQDKLLSSFKYKKIISYRNLRALLLRQICKIYLSTQVFQKILNIKKFICMFAILVFEILEQTKNILEEESIRRRQRKNIRRIILKQVKQLSNNKQYYEYLNTTYKRLEGYAERNNSDTQSRYINQDQKGVKSFKIIQQIKVFVDKIYNIIQQLNQYEDKLDDDEGEDHYELTQSCYNQSINKMKGFLKDENKLKIQCYLLVQTEMKDAISGKNVHKIPDDQYRTKQNYNLITKRFLILLEAYFSLDQSNVYYYESLIIPLLKLDDQKKLQLKMLDEMQIETEFRNLKAVAQIIKTSAFSALIRSNYKSKYP